jgi:hypothetical protein
MTRFGRLVLWLPWVLLAILGIYSLADLFTISAQEINTGMPWIEIVINSVLRLIPIVLLLFSLGLFIEVLAEEYQLGHMKWRVRGLLFWTPRVALLIFAFLISLLALDVFDMGYGFWGTIGALLIHLIPVGVILVVAAITWRWEWVGTLLLTVWAIWYLVVASGFPISVYLMMAGLPFVLGLLFLLNWRYRAELRLEA